MTQTEIDILITTIKGLWPRVAKPVVGWSPGEWSVLDEQAGRIQVDADQAVAAIRGLKARSDKYPTVSAMLGALRTAENRPVAGPCSPVPVGYNRPEPLQELNEHGRTSFEQRCIDDESFAKYAEKHGRLSPERAVQILGRAWDAKPPTRNEAKAEMIDRRMELHEAVKAVRP